MDDWRILGDNPNYQVSSSGRVRRVSSEIDKTARDRKGYLVVDTYLEGNRKTERVHRLVAEAFVPNPDNKPEVNHIDGNKYNNKASNLEWVTKKENCRHAWDNGFAEPSRSMLGRSNPNAGRKSKPIRVIETGEVYKKLEDCAQAINGSNKHINDCLRGRQRTHRGYTFEYV